MISRWQPRTDRSAAQRSQAGPAVSLTGLACRASPLRAASLSWPGNRSFRILLAGFTLNLVWVPSGSGGRAFGIATWLRAEKTTGVFRGRGALEPCQAKGTFNLRLFGVYHLHLFFTILLCPSLCHVPLSSVPEWWKVPWQLWSDAEAWQQVTFGWTLQTCQLHGRPRLGSSERGEQLRSDNREQCGLCGLGGGPRSLHRHPGRKPGWCHLPSKAGIPSRTFLVDGHLASAFPLAWHGPTLT